MECSTEILEHSLLVWRAFRTFWECFKTLLEQMYLATLFPAWLGHSSQPPSIYVFIYDMEFVRWWTSANSPWRFDLSLQSAMEASMQCLLDDHHSLIWELVTSSLANVTQIFTMCSSPSSAGMRDRFSGKVLPMSSCRSTNCVVWDICMAKCIYNWSERSSLTALLPINFVISNGPNPFASSLSDSVSGL